MKQNVILIDDVEVGGNNSISLTPVVEDDELINNKDQQNIASAPKTNAKCKAVATPMIISKHNRKKYTNNDII
ncbi:1284_t:CDS:2 [Funneliformis caledonium]|uniref:1284_t:CDS:1 n=1 Tax=Funneliformis caledonium TaxID=1117310 RepID=A0A9N9E806_9GLOM|nr:1284_t:CDS:2 [Funneliformis caledonium]